MKRKKIILIVSLCAVFAVALTLSLLGKFVFGWFDKKETPYVPPTLEEGEAYYYFAGGTFRDVVLMYPQLGREDIGLIRVHNTKGENYFFYHEQEGSSNYFLLGSSTDDTFTDSDIYYPPIISEWGGTFDYTTLYDDSSTLPIMLAAVGAVRIGERLRPEDGNFSEEWLSHYGLAEADDPAYFEIVPYLRDENGNYIYTDGTGNVAIGRHPDDGKYYRLDQAEDGRYVWGEVYSGDTTLLKPRQDAAGIRRVYVGHQTVDDAGYYLRLEGRNTVYTTTNASVSEVVNRNVGYYVAPRAVTKAESNYSYQISPNISVYQGKYSRDPETVISALMALGLNVPDMWVSGGGNGVHVRDWFLQVDLGDTDNAVFLAAFLGAKIGEARDILVRETRIADIGSTVRYHITELRGYYDAETHTYCAAADAGSRTVRAGDKLIISYRLGEGDTEYVGLLDLGQANLPPVFAGNLVGQAFGVIPGAPLTVEITYDESTAFETESETLGLLEITAITDRATGTAAAVAGAGCDVTLRFSRRYGESYSEYESVTLSLPAAEDTASDEKWLALNGTGQSVTVLRAIAGLVTGRGVASYEGADVPETSVTYAVEYLSDFALYLGASAGYVNRYEEVISFGYTNRSNVFFGSSRYAITSPDSRTLYGLDATMALAVMRVFEDLVGDETVALGLDAAAIERWGLYAYRVYYEMPFDCYSLTRKDGGEDYYYKNKIGYELLIGEKQPDGSRYVGSTQFNTVVKFEQGELFDFAEWSFEQRWAQSNLLLVSYEDLRSLVVDLNFSDGGDYSRIWAFDTAVDRAYQYATRYYENGVEKVTYTTGSRLYASLVDGGAHTGHLTAEQLWGILRYDVGTDASARTEAGQLVLDDGYYQRLKGDFRSLDEIYGNRTDDKTSQYYEGATYFQTLLQIMNTTYYFRSVAEELSEAEVAALMADDRANVMTLAFTMRDADNHMTHYTIRFYTYSQHTLVSLTNEETGIETHDFYIQTREVYKIADAVVALTKGENIDNNRY